ncbi:MAG: hypothetical protein ACKN81_17660, partial [Pirellulaceae bacterium]
MIREMRKDKRRAVGAKENRGMGREKLFSLSKWKTIRPVRQPIAIAGLLLTLLAAKATLQAQTIERKEGAWEAFPAAQVQFLEGSPFRSQLEVNAKTLLTIGVDRALYAFRVQAGLPTLGAKPLRGWATPEPSGAFPGFFEGHYLLAFSEFMDHVVDQWSKAIVGSCMHRNRRKVMPFKEPRKCARRLRCRPTSQGF